MIRHSLKIGFNFGVTSGIITTLGLIVGLHAGTGSRLVVIGGILTIAIADALSDALGIHISEESENVHTTKQIWISTISTFLSKFFFALTFIIPILLFELPVAIIVSIIWGLCIMCLISFSIARKQKIRPWKVILEHLIIALSVIVITHFVGNAVAGIFNN
jgi:VIT1/CCC1 family predicted Fe2+/Mn2+ transporter